MSNFNIKYFYLNGLLKIYIDQKNLYVPTATFTVTMGKKTCILKLSKSFEGAVDRGG